METPRHDVYGGPSPDGSPSSGSSYDTDGSFTSSNGSEEGSIIEIIVKIIASLFGG